MSVTAVDRLGEVAVVESADDGVQSFLPERRNVLTFVADVADEGKGEEEVADEVAEDGSFRRVEVLVVGAAKSSNSARGLEESKDVGRKGKKSHPSAKAFIGPPLPSRFFSFHSKRSSCRSSCPTSARRKYQLSCFVKFSFSLFRSSSSPPCAPQTLPFPPYPS